MNFIKGNPIDNTTLTGTTVQSSGAGYLSQGTWSGGTSQQNSSTQQNSPNLFNQFQLGSAYNLYTYPIPNYSILDIENRNLYLEKNIEDHKTITKEKQILDSLCPETKEVIKLIHSIMGSNNPEDLIKVDKYVKSLLFNTKLENIID